MPHVHRYDASVPQVQAQHCLEKHGFLYCSSAREHATSSSIRALVSTLRGALLEYSTQQYQVPGTDHTAAPLQRQTIYAHTCGQPVTLLAIPSLRGSPASAFPSCTAAGFHPFFSVSVWNWPSPALPACSWTALLLFVTHFCCLLDYFQGFHNIQ